MKIFHIGLCVYSELEGLTFSMADVCEEYRQVRPETPDGEILRIADEFKPDLIFIQVQDGGPISVQTVEQLSKISLAINWTGDARQPIPLWYYHWSPYCITCFSNELDVNVFKQKGLKSEYLQIGIDPEIFHYYEGEKGNDIVFMANRYMHFPESRNREFIANKLKKTYGNHFSLIGNGWPNANLNLNGNQIAEARFYSGSKIAINHSQFAIDRYSSDRLYRILASGCFCLSHHFPGIEKDFEPGKHLVTYHNPEDMINKINYYLEHAEEREKIRQAGYEYCHQTFRYDNMIQNMLEIYEKYRL